MHKYKAAAETIIISLILTILTGCYNLIKIKMDTVSKTNQINAYNQVIEKYKENKNSLTDEQKKIYIELLEAKSSK